jgi:hypothetical protein
VLVDVLNLDDSYCVKIWNSVTAVNAISIKRSNSRMANFYVPQTYLSCRELTYIMAR